MKMKMNEKVIIIKKIKNKKNNKNNINHNNHLKKTIIIKRILIIIIIKIIKKNNNKKNNINHNNHENNKKFTSLFNYSVLFIAFESKFEKKNYFYFVFIFVFILLIFIFFPFISFFKFHKIDFHAL